MDEEILYHYTSLETLYKIAENQKNNKITLRATHARFMNDPIEYEMAFSLIQKAYDEFEKTNNITEKFNLKNFFKLRDIFGYPFILSFSEKHDNLTMWRTYGSNGSGIAIGFDKAILEKYVEFNKNQNLNLIKCKYDEIQIINDLIEYLKIHYYDFTGDNLKFSPNLNGSFQTLFELALNSFRFKNVNYEIEDEWRLCKNECSFSNIHFLNSNDLKKPYINHEFEKSIIKKIIIGPSLDQEIVKESIFLYLKVHNFPILKTSIISSSVPYREI